MRMLAALAAAPLVLGSMAGPAVAVQDEVTPSTNKTNLENGWAHYTATADYDGVELTFTTTRGFDSCFEIRVDGEAPLDGQANPNTDVDGLWDYVCVNALGATDRLATETRRVEADGFVEVRLVFGAERDERFDWELVTTLTPQAPATAQECKKGGFAALGYANQGRCVSAVKKAQRDARKAAKAEQRAAMTQAKGAKKVAKATAKNAKKGKE